MLPFLVCFSSIVCHGVGPGFLHFQPIGDLLEAGHESLNFLLLCGDLLLLFFDLAMFLEEFVEQHCVHLVVANGEGLTLVIAHHQVWTDLCHLFRDQTELRSTFGIHFLLVAKSNRLERENRFARLVHWLNVLLEADCRSSYPKLTTGAHRHWLAPGHRHPANPCDKSGSLRSARPDADHVGLRSHSSTADVDI